MYGISGSLAAPFMLVFPACCTAHDLLHSGGLILKATCGDQKERSMRRMKRSMGAYRRGDSKKSNI